jgi:hypothetical protein
VEFTEEQFKALTEALGLDEDATPDEVVEAVQKLTAEGAEDEDTAPAEPGEIKASRGGSVTIDSTTWAVMQKSIRLGLRARQQENRLAAEAVIDQFIRASRAPAGERERLIDSYLLDPDDTVRRLRRREAIPMVEVGHSLNVSNDDLPGPQWVR